MPRPNPYREESRQWRSASPISPTRSTRSSPTSSETMEIHHDKHHAAYVTNLNAALEGTEWAEQSLEAILTSLDSIPEDKRMAVRNNGGGHATTRCSGRSWRPNGGGEPILGSRRRGRGRLRRCRRAEGGRQRRRREALRLGLDVARLGRHRADRKSTPNQDTPAMDGGRRSSASTSGSTRTTSTTRIGAPTTSRRGGTSSTGGVGRPPSSTPHVRARSDSDSVPPGRPRWICIPLYEGQMLRGEPYLPRGSPPTTPVRRRCSSGTTPPHAAQDERDGPARALLGVVGEASS